MLEIQREHQPDPAEAHEVHQPEGGSRRVARRGGQQPSIEQGRAMAPHHPMLPADEQRHHHRRQRKQPPQPAQPTGVNLHQGQQQAQHTTAQQQRADHVEVRSHWHAATRPDGHQSPCCDQRDQAYRNVDVEDPPPTLLLPRRAQDETAEHRSDGGGQPDRGAEDAKRPAPLCAAEQHLNQSRFLGCEHPSGEALQQPGGDQQLGAGCGSAQRAGQYETGEGHEEHPPPAQGVTQPAACHQHQPERERGR